MADNQSQSKILNRILIELKPKLPSILLSLLMALISVICTLRIPILTGRAIDNIIGYKDIDLDGLYLVFKEMVVMAFSTSMATLVMNWTNNRITYGVTNDLRVRAFKKLQKMKLSEIDSHAHGDYVSRIVNDADTFADGLLMGFTQAFTGVLTIVGTIYFMFSIDWRIAIIVVILTPASLLLAKFISTKIYRYFTKQAETKGAETAFVEEIIKNENIVRDFNFAGKAQEDFIKLNDELTNASLKATFYSSLVNPSTRLINNLIYAMVGVCGALIAIAGGITVGGLTSFLSYASSYGKPFNEITGVVTEFQNALACAERLFEVIDAEIEVDQGKNEITEIKGKIEFKDVAFSYDKSKKLIQNLNLTVEPGQRVAIVGPTGAGKSTIINLLMRFYDVDEGQILLDGVDIREIPLEKLRTSFGMVLQETWLKQDSIKNNIAMACENPLEEEIIEAAKATHSHSFIKRMKNGYDTVISSELGQLSQGQLQLLCITRVMLNIPPMLILDEATSSIDTRTEQKIQSAFNKMMEGRTTFVVAHRLSTIREADIILFVKDGQVVEQGNHVSLLQKNGFYAKLYQSQFKESNE